MALSAGFQPDNSNALTAESGPGSTTGTDQVTVIGSVVLGLWLVGKSFYLVVA